MISAKYPAAPSDLVRRVQNDPNYIELERARNSLVRILVISMMVIYFAFIFLVAFDKDLLAIKVYGVVTLAFPVCLFVMLSALGITGFYVSRANS